MAKIIWIDKEIYNEENSKYVKDLESDYSLIIRLYQGVNEAINYIKDIDFEETKIIVSGRLFSEFVKKFKQNINKICISPKIIVFTGNEDRFLEYNKDYKNTENAFYNYGGIATVIDEVKDFLIGENKNINAPFFISELTEQLGDTNYSTILTSEEDPTFFDKSEDIELTFEYIDSKKKLVLPLFFKSLMDNTSNFNQEEYTKLLYNNYSKNEEIKKILGPILSIPNIPIEILSKYYVRIFTLYSDFHFELNKDLRLNKTEKYLPFIKTLYEGVKLKSLPLANDNILYRGSLISNDEIDKIIKYLSKKREGLPSSIVFSKSFLSFTKDKTVALKFLENEEQKENLSKVLFIIEKDTNEGYNLSTHGDIEKISYYPNEKEVLFFPFSSFEIKDLKKIKIGKEKGYEIQLLYLGKYLKEIENDKNLITDKNKTPDTIFKKRLSESGLILKEKIESINTEKLYKSFKKYETEINGQIIFGEINIKSSDINKNILIINSFENLKRINRYKDEEDDWRYENEKEIKENIEIKINRKVIDFSYFYNFEKEGKYEIEYIFRKNLTKTNHLFFGCKSLTYLNFSYFDTQNVTNMFCMFSDCKSLKKINFSNIKTQNVTNFGSMFSCCSSLSYLDLSDFDTSKANNMSHMFSGCDNITIFNLSNFDTQNVTDMSFMFSECKTLPYLDLSNFNTKNVIDMSYMFSECRSLLNVDLSRFSVIRTTNIYGIFLGCKSLLKNNVITNDNIIKEQFE